MICLTREELVFYNKSLVLLFGGAFFQGPGNIRNRNSFEFLLDAPKQKLFELELYPNIFLQAATYLFYIIKDHIFFDGNKRTGMMAAFLFLEKNEIRISQHLGQSRIVKYADRIASCKPNIENISNWLRGISVRPA